VCSRVQGGLRLAIWILLLRVVDTVAAAVGSLDQKEDGHTLLGKKCKLKRGFFRRVLWCGVVCEGVSK
jgi:hypothetical protein